MPAQASPLRTRPRHPALPALKVDRFHPNSRACPPESVAPARRRVAPPRSVCPAALSRQQDAEETSRAGEQRAVAGRRKRPQPLGAAKWRYRPAPRACKPCPRHLARAGLSRSIAPSAHLLAIRGVGRNNSTSTRVWHPVSALRYFARSLRFTCASSACNLASSSPCA